MNNISEMSVERHLYWIIDHIVDTDIVGEIDLIYSRNTDIKERLNRINKYLTDNGYSAVIKEAEKVVPIEVVSDKKGEDKFVAPSYVTFKEEENEDIV